MIICFSGTGNSRKVADRIQATANCELVRLAPGYMNHPEKIRIDVSDGRLIWILPVHSWGLPNVVKEVIRKADIISSNGDLKHHLIFTCGDDIGLADKQWRKEITKRGWIAHSAFSVQMPNSYTFMKGFDVDSKEVELEKIAKMDPRVDEIMNSIESGEKRVDVVRGKFAWVKTKIIHPLFMEFMTSTKPFHATDDCMGCRRCAINCPLINIEIVDGKPKWGDKCCMCTRCYHCCPKHAVAYGKATEGKGQYICPGYELK